MTESQYDAIKELCYKYYSKRNLAHALSVEEYITNESFYYCAPEDAQYQMRAVALAHDLLEDTKCSLESLKEISESCARQVLALTQMKDMDYMDYIDSIFQPNTNFIVKLVKMCDMKDHLARKATLTEKLSKKYKPATEAIYHYFTD